MRREQAAKGARFSMYLLDVNVLIAIADPCHVHHAVVAPWFSQHLTDGWATCPLTENGFLRILGQSSYPGGPGSPEKARELLRRISCQNGHRFWPDSVSLCDATKYSTLPSPKHLTDYYLLALAVEHQAQLATLDRYIDPALVPGGAAAYHLIAVT